MSSDSDMDKVLRELLVKFEQVLPKLVWKDVPPDSHQRGLTELIARYRPCFFHGTGEGFFVTLTTYEVPLDEDPRWSSTPGGTTNPDERRRYDGAVAYEGTIVRLPAEVAERVTSFAEKDKTNG